MVLLLSVGSAPRRALRGENPEKQRLPDPKNGSDSATYILNVLKFISGLFGCLSRLLRETHLLCELLGKKDDDETDHEGASADEQEVDGLAAFLVEVRSEV